MPLHAAVVQEVASRGLQCVVVQHWMICQLGVITDCAKLGSNMSLSAFGLLPQGRLLGIRDQFVSQVAEVAISLSGPCDPQVSTERVGWRWGGGEGAATSAVMAPAATTSLWQRQYCRRVQNWTVSGAVRVHLPSPTSEVHHVWSASALFLAAIGQKCPAGICVYTQLAGSVLHCCSCCP